MSRRSLSCYVATVLGATVFLTTGRALAVPELTDMPFLQSSDFASMSGVSLAAQVPTQTMSLYHKGTSGSVWQTPMAARVSNGVPQIWYMRFDYAGNESDINRRTLCYGEIQNGAWTLPALNSGSAPWGGPNNIVLTRTEGSAASSFSPQQIVTDPSGGLLMTYWDKPSSGNPGVMRATASSAGTSWTKVSGTVFTDPLDTFTTTRVASQYRMYQTGEQAWSNKPVQDNLPNIKRVITYRTSNDSASWTAQNVNSPMLAPDATDIASDNRTEFYAFKSFQYGSGYGGLLWKYYADPNHPGDHGNIYKTELVTSSDGVNWQRPFRNTDLGFFSYADPIHYNGNFSFAATGLGGTSIEGDTVLQSWVNDRMIAAVGNGGTFRTQPFYFPSTGIDINTDTSNGASIDVTCCDQNGTPIVGWSSFHIQNDNVTNLQLPWSAGHEPVSLRVTINGNAKVFGISAHGYVPVPEPTSFILLATGIPIVWSCRKRHQRQKKIAPVDQQSLSRLREA